VQKLQDWTAGSISTKLRGLNDKNRTNQPIILNGGGQRVDSKETQGLFSKATRPKGVPSNLHHQIWIRWFGPDLTREPVSKDLGRRIVI
jgi:hypothetical protein